MAKLVNMLEGDDNTSLPDHNSVELASVNGVVGNLKSLSQHTSDPTTAKRLAEIVNVLEQNGLMQSKPSTTAYRANGDVRPRTPERTIHLERGLGEKSPEYSREPPALPQARTRTPLHTVISKIPPALPSQPVVHTSKRRP